MKKIKREVKGITLIALVVTIIVLLILAGISIRLFMNEGLIDRGIQTRFISNFSEIEEKLKLYVAGQEIDIIENNEEKSIEEKLPLLKKVTQEEKQQIINEIPSLEEEILIRNLDKNIKDINLYEIDKEKIGAENIEHKYIIDIDSNQIYDYEGEYFFNKRWHTNALEVNSKIEEMKTQEPAKPIIYSYYGYPVITDYGIINGNTAKIKFEERSYINNYYSLDNEETWVEYEGEIELLGTCTIIAKSVNRITGVESKNSKEIVVPTDAIGAEAYDGDENTSFNYSGTKYMLVDTDMQYKKIYIYGQTQMYASTSTGTIVCYDENNNRIKDITINGLGTSELRATAELPSNTAKIGISMTTLYGTRYLHEVVVANEPVISAKLNYPLIKTTGVEVSNIINIKYAPTSEQKLYKIGDGEWLNYTEEIELVGKDATIYAKGIDKNGNETRIVSQHKLALPEDAIGYEAYDGDENTAFSYSGTKSICIDSEITNKRLYVNANTQNSYGSVTFSCYDINGNFIENITQTWNSGAKNVELPQQTYKITINMKTLYGTRYIREIRLAE